MNLILIDDDLLVTTALKIILEEYPLGNFISLSNSTAPSELPRMNFLFFRNTPDSALKWVVISPISLVQLWNNFSAG